MSKFSHVRRLSMEVGRVMVARIHKAASRIFRRIASAITIVEFQDSWGPELDPKHQDPFII